MSGRPEILFPLFSGLETLEGIGPKTAQNMEHMGVTRPRDLLFTLPYAVIDRRRRDTIKGVDLPKTLTVAVTIGPHRKPANRSGAYRIQVEDAQTSFQLVYFHARGDYLQKLLPTGARRLVSGKVELFDGIAQMVHPDHIVDEADADEIPAQEPVYPLTSGVTQKTLFKATRATLARAPDLAEWIDPALKARENWPDWQAAITKGHSPERMD